MGQKIASLCFLTGSALILGSFQNCSKENFTGPDGVEIASSCQTNLTEQTGVIKILFMMDVSGSNANAKDFQGTDDGKHWRAAMVNNFLTAYAGKTNFYYNISVFHDTEALSLTNDSHGDPIFSNDPSVISQSLAQFMNEDDTSNTPYAAALDLAHDMIAHDLANSASAVSKPHYAVMFSSDGSPDGYAGIGDNKKNGNAVDGMASLASDVSRLVSAAPGLVTLNTVYYYKSSEDPDAEQVLQSMAQTGGGQFMIANSGETPTMSDLITVPNTSCVASQ